MSEVTQVVRYSGEDALVVLKSDIESTLTNLKSIEKIKDFRFVNEALLDKVNQIRCAVTLKTERSQVITITFFFLERVCETAFVHKGDALFENILINRSIATCKDIQSLVHSILLSRFKGFILEDLALDILNDAVDVNGIIQSVRHGKIFEDRRGKDFILEVVVKGKKFDFFFDLKSPGSFRLAKKKKRKKTKKESKILISATSELLKKSPKVFLGRVYEHIINEHKRRFLDSSSGTKKHPYTK